MSDRFPFTLLSPPEDLPEYDPDLIDEISYIGQTLFISGIYQNHDLFGIKRTDRPRHLYVLGKSGMGKSYFLENLIRSDIEADMGIGVIDPHGDLVNKLIKRIPADRIEEVVYIDPSDSDNPIAFNPFENVPIENRQLVSQGLVEIFKKQFASTWSPQIEHLFRFATLAMLEYPEGTLYGLLQLITDSEYRQHVIKHIDDDIIKRFFSVEFASYVQKYDQEAITPLTSRLGHFFSDPLMRRIFTNPENKIDVADIMDNGHILLVNTSKGTLGEENSALFGSFFLTKIEQAAMARSRQAEEDREPFYLYVDEFQNVATESFISLFSESRKYAINITLANQYLSQIQDRLINSILGNVGIMCVFRVGGQDALRMSQEFQPQLKPHDFLNLGLGEFYIKMSIDGKTTLPFSATTMKLPEAKHPENASAVIEFTHDNYCQGKRTEKKLFKSRKKSTKAEDLPPPL